jgi:hypothetical protein
MHYFILIAVAAADFPFHSGDPNGVSVIELDGGSRIEVISEELSSFTDSFSFSYRVDGVRITGTGFTDTLFWLSDPPDLVLSESLRAGIRSLAESRTVRILVLDESCLGGVLRVVSSRNGRSPSEFKAFRTWLIDGTILDLESVVQLDALFYETLADVLGLERGIDVESELWVLGFWLDPQSFLVYKGTDEPPFLRLGLPSTEGMDTLLVVDILFSSLTSATGAMMD